MGPVGVYRCLYEPTALPLSYAVLPSLGVCGGFCKYIYPQNVSISLLPCSLRCSYAYIALISDESQNLDLSMVQLDERLLAAAE